MNNTGMKKLLVAMGVLAAVNVSAENIPNPILPNVADIGVMKYNGKYYLGGCRTDGDFYISSDLVNWEGPIHVIDMDNDWSKGSGCGNNQIHANDMLYDNGTIHAYWSVNYWGKDKHAVHVVHSEASDPMGPYAEPIRDRWMDNRIDPKVFRDDDGKIYMYMVRFTDGNAIWARKMKNWREFDETDPQGTLLQFSSNPNTWERMDNAVAEGPWVMKYHGKYYMMYNANHTGHDWGNYQLGVAQSDTPMGFNAGNKYPHPVVYSNQYAIEYDYPDLLRYSTGNYDPLFNYVTTVPATDTNTDWTQPDFNDRTWKQGLGGFAKSAPRGTTTYTKGTQWDTERIRLRKAFNLTNLSDNLALRLTTIGASKVYLNGTEIYSSDRPLYNIVNLTPEMKKNLKIGRNVLAIECTAPQRGNQYVNAQLFNSGTTQIDPEITWTPGQPNILRGPNGLEWWLIYMANTNMEGRNQHVDRVHFHGDKMYVDGITHANNSGFHPTPALPAYGDTFESAPDTTRWANLDPARWSVANGELKATPDNGAPLSAVLAPTLASESYLWEVNLKPLATAGIYAAYTDAENNVAVLFDHLTKMLTIVETLNGDPRTIATMPLRPDFRWDAYPQLRVERDLADLTLSIDEMRIAEPFTSFIAQSAVPGIVTMGAPSTFDGVTYTVGFDDGNDRMNGWRNLTGALAPTKRGATASGQLKAVKGTPGYSYEFTTQISNLGDNAVAGIYPMYIDDNNYVLAQIDAPTQSLRVTTMRRGKIVDRRSIPLDTMRDLYTDQRFTDSYDKGYTFDCPTTFDAIYLPRYDVANRNMFTDSRFDKDIPTIGTNEIVHDNTFALMTPAYITENDTWQTIPTEGAMIYDANPAFSVASFEPVTAERIRFINNDPSDGSQHIYRIRVHELFKDSYNLRTVRSADGSLRIFVDGREVASIPVDKFGASLVGLDSQAGSPEFHGTLYYHR